MLNQNEAPKGYIAVPVDGVNICKRCEWQPKCVASKSMCTGCVPDERKDRNNVIFKLNRKLIIESMLADHNLTWIQAKHKVTL